MRERNGATMEFHDRHRPLGAYFGALGAAGLRVEDLREPIPDDAYVAAHPEVERWRHRPCFLQVLARPPA